MGKLTRRSFVAGASAVPFALWLEGCKPKNGGDSDGGGSGPEPQDGPLIRYDARSPEGQEMLQIYAEAVDKMQTFIQEGEPISWVFQWYTHGVKGSTTKAAEIARIYPNPSPDRDLAEEVWETCHAHYPGDDENFFLPWHRMYVFFFESIIREVSGNASFTLPYWNYSTSDLAIRGVIPPQFGQQGSALFVGKRNPGVNDGDPIQGNDQSQLDLDSLAQCTYKPAGAEQGFNMKLDFGLHGNIHVLTGNGQNMGSVPWAAGDPIFWMHHCNIDRLWASWNAAGRQNPTSDPIWMGKTFKFADASGNGVVATVSDFDAIEPLGYAYDHLEPVPACPAAAPQLLDAANSMSIRAAASTPVALTGTAVQVALGSLPGDQAFSISPEVESEDRTLYIVVKGLEAQTQPEVLYHLYLGLPADADEEAQAQHRVGSVNFFGAVGHGDGGAHGAHGAHGEGEETAEVTEKFISFNITDLARRLKSEGTLGAEPTLTIVPDGEPVVEAQAVLGEVLLVEQ